jgi:hypothetical protein
MRFIMANSGGCLFLFIGLLGPRGQQVISSELLHLCDLASARNIRPSNSTLCQNNLLSLYIPVYLYHPDIVFMCLGGMFWMLANLPKPNKA